MSEWLNLNTLSRKTRFRRPLLHAVQIEYAHLRQARELVLGGTLGDSYPGLLGSYELPVLVEPQRDVRCVEFSVADSLPRAMGHAEYGVRISTSEKRTIGSEREEDYTLAPGATGRHEPRPGQAAASFADNILTGDPRAPGNNCDG
jgi:hypothetical protein